jgi:IS30 family transposase
MKKGISNANGRCWQEQIPKRKPLSERPFHIEARRQVGYEAIAKEPNKTSELVNKAIASNLKPFTARVKTLTYDERR